MASRFVVAVALFAVCYSSPVDDKRGKRSFTVAEGFSSAFTGGRNTASAVVDGTKADAQASNDNGGNVGLDAFGNGLPGQAFAKVGTFDGALEPARFGYAQPAYYPVPAPATVVAYQKYADVPAEVPSQIIYQAPTPALAQSSAATKGGYGSANSNAKSGYGSATSNANAQGSGQNTASSLAQSDGLASPVEPVVIAAKTHGLRSEYTPVNTASSSAKVNGNYGGSAYSTAKTGAVPTRKSISWRFGTAYDHPAAYGAARAAVTNLGYGSAAANSAASGLGLNSAAKAVNGGSAQSAADNTAGYSSVKSATNTYSGGYANADANVRNGNYAVLRSDNGYAGYGGIKSSASSHNGGSAISKAHSDSAGNEYVDSAARSGAAGSAQSAASSDGGSYGVRSSGAYGGRLVSDAYSQGESNAASSVRSHGQGLSAGYRVVNSNANSGAFGAARSNAYAN